MKQSKTELYVHFVWAAYQRMPLVTPQIEAALYGCIGRVARQYQCEVVALGGTEDHIHLLLKMPAKHAPAFLMQQIKGTSSVFVRDCLAPGKFFSWQDGYGAFSVTPSHRNKVGDYVRDQKRHHAEGTVHSIWEETNEDVAPAQPSSRPQDA